MQPLPLARAFTLIEPGPVVLLTTHDGRRPNVMALSWTMVRGFGGQLAMTTGPWNHSWQALQARRDCVLAVPPAALLDLVVGVGTCSGAATDKFARFGLQALPAARVGAPLLDGMIGQIECQVTAILPDLDLVLLQAVAAWTDPALEGAPMLHAAGDGTFTADGARLDRRAAMRDKLPEGL